METAEDVTHLECALTNMRAKYEQTIDEKNALRAEVELAQSESRKARKRVAELSAEVERLQERFDAVRDAAHAEAKRVFPATVIESHIGGELHADDLCSMLASEVERLREENAFWRGHLSVLSPKMDGQHVWRLFNGWPPLIGPDADAVVRNALEAIRSQPLPAPPAKEE